MTICHLDYCAQKIQSDHSTIIGFHYKCATVAEIYILKFSHVQLNKRILESLQMVTTFMKLKDSQAYHRYPSSHSMYGHGGDSDTAES
ncbi:hypothetical protein T05_13401 [Trichinella murrelli]|uniref:Uncharacterized protein n=1 Tax=Trichinella murrelli TaxID=144512 RepID=A0A0V0TP38_9BILA|nr:hypothetical protein T05_13401 [Trichinella murrelli]